MISLKINGMPVEVPAGSTILDAARKANVKIPTLCYHPDLKPWAACGICIVRNAPSPKLLRACCTEVTNGMNITTHDPDIIRVRKTIVKLLLSTHPADCLSCPRSGTCELQAIAAELGIREIPYDRKVRRLPKDESTSAIILDQTKCIKCGRCAQVCQQMQNVWALEFIGRGEKTVMTPAAGVSLADSPCIKCGQCAAHCPVGAIYERDDRDKVWEALEDQSKHCVVQMAPAVRVAIGEEFGLKPGAISTGKLYTALRRLGFNAVFDTNFSADVTIMEEGTEFVKRFTKEPGAGPLPLITSCCPAWTDWMEKYATDFIDNFSTCKSPQQMLSALAKSYYPKVANLDPASIHMTSIMPCTAKKYEIDRCQDMNASGHQDTDVVLTTREFARMLRVAGIQFEDLEESKADSILGDYSGAGTIFGVTGGVMEAALRTAYTLITKKELADVNFTAVRGMEGVKEAVVEIDGVKVAVAVAHQMGNVEKVLNAIREDRAAGRPPRWQFIEVMACRGGCIGGGGQPLGTTDEIRAQRTAGLYTDDERSAQRCSHRNPEVVKLYKDYLEKPGSEKSHHLLHTHYERELRYKK
ncbi:MAG: NADH-dependent [FeFe] hydrogenase, group A6 [Kiritimatiellia bacterium]